MMCCWLSIRRLTKTIDSFCGERSEEWRRQWYLVASLASNRHLYGLITEHRRQSRGRHPVGPKPMAQALTDGAHGQRMHRGGPDILWHLSCRIENNRLIERHIVTTASSCLLAQQYKRRRFSGARAGLDREVAARPKSIHTV